MAPFLQRLLRTSELAKGINELPVQFNRTEASCQPQSQRAERQLPAGDEGRRLPGQTDRRRPKDDEKTTTSIKQGG